MEFEKSEFAQWRNNEIYEELAKFIRQEMSDSADTMLNRKYCDDNQDMFIRGALTACQVILEWKPEFKKEEVEEEDENEET